MEDLDSAGTPNGGDLDVVGIDALTVVRLIEPAPVDPVLPEGGNESVAPLPGSGAHPADPADPDTDTLISRAESAQRSASASTAALWGAISDALDAARSRPWEWLPTPFGATSPSDRELAERAVAADLAIRLRMSEGAVRSAGARAASLRHRLPVCWREFCRGDLSPAHVLSVLECSATLEGAALVEFDERVAELGASLPVRRVRERARRLAERLCSVPLQERHDDALTRRGVWVETTDDGMAWLTALLPQAAATRAKARIDLAAGRLAMAGDETRTRDQLRSDVLADLLTGDGTPDAVGATVCVTVPVLTLLGGSGEEKPDAVVPRGPGDDAFLDGRIPIDDETARRLAGDATSFLRLLTDPIDSSVLDVDRRSYRPPADLRRWVTIRDERCRFPGCGRVAAECDLDHTEAWGEGGETSADNLAAVCPPHHRLKHETRWAVSGRRGELRWTSPTGRVSDSDPPPF